MTSAPWGSLHGNLLRLGPVGFAPKMVFSNSRNRAANSLSTFGLRRDRVLFVRPIAIRTINAKIRETGSAKRPERRNVPRRGPAAGSLRIGSKALLYSRPWCGVGSCFPGLEGSKGLVIRGMTAPPTEGVGDSRSPCRFMMRSTARE